MDHPNPFANPDPSAHSDAAASTPPKPLRLPRNGPVQMGAGDTIDLDPDELAGYTPPTPADAVPAEDVGLAHEIGPVLVHGPVEVAEHTAPDGSRQVVLTKNEQRHVLACGVGRESELLARLTGIVNDTSNDLTWFDAALVCHQLGERMGAWLSEPRGRRSA